MGITMKDNAWKAGHGKSLLHPPYFRRKYFFIFHFIFIYGIQYTFNATRSRMETF